MIVIWFGESGDTQQNPAPDFYPAQICSPGVPHTDDAAFHLATAEGDQPHVRGMLLYRANGTQIRVMGRLEELTNPALKEEIMNHPTRKFLQAWKDLGVDHLFTVFCLKNGKATTWTMDSNFDDKVWIDL